MARHSKRHKVKTAYLHGIAVREVRPGYYLADLMRDGKRTRRAFRSLDDAAVWCRSKSVEIRNHGTAALAMDDRQRVEYLEAVRALDGRATVAEAVRFWLERHPTHGVEKWGAAALRYIQQMKSGQRRKASIADKEIKLGILGDALGDAAPLTLDDGDIDRAVKALAAARGWGEVTRRAYRNAGLTLLRFVRGKSKRVSLRDERPPEIWDAETVGRLLHAAEVVSPEIVGALAVMAFAGVRPNEALRLKWEHIRLDGDKPLIALLGDVTKTRSTRHVAVSRNLLEWLTRYRRESGLLVATPARMRLGRERAMREAGIAAWPKDVLRHTAATMLHGLTHDAAYTSAQLGHTGGTQVFERHYRGLAPAPDEVERFWSILPERQEVTA
jgi:integrase